MDKFDKKLVMFYRGKDNSNKISSSTQNAILKYKDVFDMDFINLDKRNYEKYFAKLKKEIDILYVWYDEELLMDYIKKTHPKIELRMYDNKNSAVVKSGRIKYIISENIIDEYKATFGYIDLWKIDEFNNEIIDVRMFKVDYENKPQNQKNNYYKSKGSAKEALKVKINLDSKHSEEMIKYYQEKIKKNNEKLKTL